MDSLLVRLRRWLAKNTTQHENVGAAGYEDFKLRYWKFKSLLELNQRFLDTMADLECLAKAASPFGMETVRAKTTMLAVVAFQIIALLDIVAAKPHDGLRRALERIQERISAELDTPCTVTFGPLLVELDSLCLENAGQVGGKMAVLGEIRTRLGLRVPSGFALTSRAYHDFMQSNGLIQRIHQLLQSTPLDDLESLYATSREIQAMITAAQVPGDVQAALDQAAANMELHQKQGLRFSVRSSALGEDGPDLSFAGQYRTELDVVRTDLGQAYKIVLASKYSARALAYRQAAGIMDEHVLMCVGVMAMVDAYSAGVAYSRDPTDPHGERVIINAFPGSGALVVDGRVELLEIRLEYHEGIWRDSLGSSDANDPNTAPLTRAEASALADASRLLEKHFNAPQDVEWVMDRNGTLWILQSRALHAAKRLERFSDADQVEPDPTKLPSPLLSGGMTASPGAAHGPARIIHGPEDAAQTQAGDVLILDSALPRWATILDRAAGIISRHGGVASHLATVAREFGVPALFSVGEGIAALQPGQKLTLDADNHAVYPGRVESVLQAGERRKPNLVRDSPVHATLLRVLKQITPLHLLNPDTPDFTQDRCQSLHDIIRYCHEIAVEHMFLLGSQPDFARRAGKRLITDVPMQWWIVDLGGGLQNTAEDAIRLDNILSRPFLAVWTGMTDVPWSGPPTPNVKGFLAVMAQSAMNSELVGRGPATGLGLGNCALVSRHFCNVTCRVGYHLAVIQAFSGDSPRENYVRFSFKGGAADERRKYKRLRLIGEVLEAGNYIVNVRGDTLTAHLDGYQPDFLLKRLKILGYLLMHTRQVDMVMTDLRQVERIRAALLANTARLIA